MAKLDLPVIVTPSRVELGKRCYRRHVLGDVLQRASFYSPSLEFGSVIHAGVGKRWNGGYDEAVRATASEWDKRFVANPEVSQKDLSVDLAVAMIRSYTEQATIAGPFTQESGEWQLVTVEDRLEVPLLLSEGPVGKLSFQIDRLGYNHRNGHLVIVDTKTSARMDKRWEKQWETSLQMKLYKAGVARAYDADPSDVDVVIEGVLKDVPSSVKYVVCPNWSQGLLDEAIRQAISIADADYKLITTSGLPRNKALVEEDTLIYTSLNYMSCFEYGVECPFRKLCTAEPEERVALLHAEYFEIKEEDSEY